MFPNNSANLSNCAISKWLLILKDVLAGFLKTLLPKWTFCVQQFFFWPKVAIIKTKWATIVFFSSAANFVRLVFKKSARYIGGTDGQS